MTTLLDAALEYARRGWPVIPLHTVSAPCSCANPSCESAGKHPRIKRWQREATTEPPVVRRWWGAWPDANIGLPTGSRAGFWVLDVDAAKGGEESLADLVSRHGRLPDTVESLTGGGGRHVFFAWPAEIVVRNRVALAEGLDVRGEGGYIVAPPSGHASGLQYCWEASSDPRDGVAIAPAPAWLLDLIGQANRRGGAQARAEPLGDRIVKGGRNAALTSLAGSMRRRGASAEAIYAAIAAENAARCVPPLSDAELRKIAGSVARYEPERVTLPERPPVRVDGIPAERPAAAEPGPPEEPPAPAHLTDWGNAQRLVALHGQDMRYCHLWKQWLIWDGRRWAPDTSGAAERLAKSTVGELYAEASQIADDDRRKALAKHAIKSEGQRAISAMLALAQSEEGVPVQPAELDADPWLLNCTNGTLDLRTGELREHRRDDLLTKLAPVEYDAGAGLELWSRFLAESTGGDADFRIFLQRAVGYSLTGETDEEKLFFVHGPTAAGKSTFLEALKGAFGDYAQTADFETFLSRQHVGGPRNDVARLAGARLVIGIEVDEGKRLAEGLVKQLTGGDTVTARFMYKEAFSFRPQMKLWLAANHAPRIKDDDEAMWRRILRVPFDHVVPESRRDPQVKIRLRDPEIAGPAILAWAVQGCLAWQEDGLGIPPMVQDATRMYRLDQDPLRDFLAMCCVFGPTKTVTIAALNEEYGSWCNDTRERPIKAREFNRRLEARGCRRDRDTSGSKRMWVGIGLSYTRGEGDSLTTLTGSDSISSKPLREADTSPTLLKNLSETVRTVRNDDGARDTDTDDPTDRGLWVPPPDIEREMQEVFGYEPED